MKVFQLIKKKNKKDEYFEKKNFFFINFSFGINFFSEILSFNSLIYWNIFRKKKFFFSFYVIHFWNGKKVFKISEALFF